MLLDKAPLGLEVPQVRHVSDVPRALFEALLCAAPGGVTLSGSVPLFRSGEEPNHRCGDIPAKPRLGPAEAPAPMVPSGAWQGRRDRSASAASARVCVLHPSEATAPDPHSKTPLEAPLVDRGNRPV